MIEWKLARVFLILTVLTYVAGSFAVHGQQSPAPPASMQQPVISWPQDFRDDYAQLAAISKTIARIEKESGLKALRDDSNALRQKLNAAIPAGYQIDEQNGRFVQLPPPPVPPPAKQPEKKNP
jgi:hypothetical protein